MQVSQTQSPLELGPEVSDLGFFDRGPAVCETFPFQKDAMAFAEWCNAVGPEKVAMLQRACKAVNFRNFADRWAFMQQHMQRLTAETEGGRGARGSTGGAAAAAAPAVANEARSKEVLQQQPPQQQQQHLMQQDAAVHHDGLQQGALAEISAGRAAGHVGQQGEAGPGSEQEDVRWIRVFTEEYEGQHGYTRRFLAASYKVIWLVTNNAKHLILMGFLGIIVRS